MNFIKEILKGIVIGIANIIPGVSGGTMMVSMGIYDKLIFSINNLFKSFKKSILTLLPYGIGMVVGIVGLAFSIEFLFEKFPFQTSMLFIGLILGGLPIIYKKVKGRKPEAIGIVLFIVFFALIIGLEFLNGTEGSAVAGTLGLLPVIKLFLIGIVASATMIIPGVSGSMILMILGYYNYILENVSGFIKTLTAFQISEAVGHAAVLLPFGIGVVVGIFAVAKLIELLLKKFERLTYFSILGLVCASPFVILSGTGIASLSPVSVITGVLVFAAGFIFAYLLASDKKRSEEEANV